MDQESTVTVYMMWDLFIPSQLLCAVQLDRPTQQEDTGTHGLNMFEPVKFV